MIAEAIREGRTALGIELGSTRIKACLVSAEDPSVVFAVGGHSWENSFENHTWTYALADVWTGIQAAYAELSADVRRRHGVRIDTIGAIGLSAMMHGYLAFDRDDRLLVPFRTWRNTSPQSAATELTRLFGTRIPLRWSIAHLYQAIRDEEPHVGSIRSLTTLAGYVHRALTGEHVAGVGDASGMFPIGADGAGYDADLVWKFDALTEGAGLPGSVADVLPRVLRAGEIAGTLTTTGALLLDPTGTLRPGVPFSPPEGDAGTGMVATDSVAPRTGNVSAGTSIFAMVVLEQPLDGTQQELDFVTTPTGHPVAMVHCNNGASELAGWADLFGRFSSVAGHPVSDDEVFDLLFREALAGEADAGGLLAYNHLAGEPIAGLTAGRPLFVRTPESRFTLANVMRAQLYGVFGTLALGMRVLEEQGVEVDRMFAHGGVFRTAGAAQRFLAGALGVPVSVGDTASEGGAWGAAVLAAFRRAVADGSADDLTSFLRTRVFAGASTSTVEPQEDDVAGFVAYLERYRAGLAVEAAAAAAL